jgi:hypothetical protein
MEAINVFKNKPKMQVTDIPDKYEKVRNLFKDIEEQLKKPREIDMKEREEYLKRPVTLEEVMKQRAKLPQRKTHPLFPKNNLKSMMDMTTGIFSFLYKNKGKIYEQAAQMIPVLVYRAESNSPITYGDLAKAIDYGSARIGRHLIIIQKIFDQLRTFTSENIPTLNALIYNKQTGMPSHGLDFAYSSYSKLDEAQKRKTVWDLNDKASNYNDWKGVLNCLGLKEYLPTRH